MKKTFFIIILFQAKFLTAQTVNITVDFKGRDKELNAFQYFDNNQTGSGVNEVNAYLLSKLSELIYTERLDFELRKLRNPNTFPASNFKSSDLSKSNVNFEARYAARFSHWFYDSTKKPIKPVSINLNINPNLVSVQGTPNLAITNSSITALAQQPIKVPGTPGSNLPSLPAANGSSSTNTNSNQTPTAMEKYLMDSIAFQKSKPIFKFLNKSQNFVSVGNEVRIPGFDPELVVISKEDYIIIVWRGTDDVIKDDQWEWIGTDFYLFLVNGDGPLTGTKLHAGIWDAFRLIKGSLIRTLDAFEAKTKNKKIFITGHSLGGGMSIISAPYLAGLGYNVAKVYTYAGPRFAGDQSFANKFSSLIPGKLERFEYGVDFVPKLWFPNYISVGSRHWLNALNNADDYNCEERKYPLADPIQYASMPRNTINKMNGDITGIVPWDITANMARLVAYFGGIGLNSTNPPVPPPSDLLGNELINAGHHNPQHYVRKTYENLSSTNKSILPAFVDTYPYVYPGVPGTK